MAAPQLVLALALAPLGGGGGVDPGYGIPEGGGGEHPWFPGYGRPDRPDQGLPGGRPPHIGGRPPGQGVNLPTHPIYRPDKPTPPGASPDAGLWVVAYVPGKGFKWVSVTPGVPEKPAPLPPDPETPTTPPETETPPPA